MKGTFILHRAVRKTGCCKLWRPYTTSGSYGPNYLLSTVNQNLSFSSYIMTYVKTKPGIAVWFLARKKPSLPQSDSTAASSLEVSLKACGMKSTDARLCLRNKCQNGINERLKRKFRDIPVEKKVILPPASLLFCRVLLYQ